MQRSHVVEHAAAARPLWACSILYMCGGVRYVPDTDDEFYEMEESEESDASDDSNTSDNKDKKPITTSASQPSSTQAGQLKRHHSDTDDDDTKHNVTVVGGSSRTKDSSAADCAFENTDAVVKQSGVDADDAQNRHSDSEAVAKKRAKLEDVTTEPATDINSHGMWCLLTSYGDHSAWVYGLQASCEGSG